MCVRCVCWVKRRHNCGTVKAKGVCSVCKANRVCVTKAGRQAKAMAGNVIPVNCSKAGKTGKGVKGR